MIEMKSLGKSIAAAALIGIVLAIVAHIFFKEWAQANTMLLGGIIGGVCGVMYPVIAKRQGK